MYNARRTRVHALADRNGDRLAARRSVPRALWSELCELAAGPPVDFADEAAIRAFAGTPPVRLESLVEGSPLGSDDVLLALGATVALPVCHVPLLALLSSSVFDSLAPVRTDRAVFAALAAGGCRRSSPLRLAVTLGVLWPDCRDLEAVAGWFDRVPRLEPVAAAAAASASGQQHGVPSAADIDLRPGSLACEAAEVVAAARAALAGAVR